MGIETRNQRLTPPDVSESFVGDPEEMTVTFDRQPLDDRAATGVVARPVAPVVEEGCPVDEVEVLPPDEHAANANAVTSRNVETDHRLRLLIMGRT